MFWRCAYCVRSYGARDSHWSDSPIRPSQWRGARTKEELFRGVILLFVFSRGGARGERGRFGSLDARVRVFCVAIDGWRCVCVCFVRESVERERPRGLLSFERGAERGRERGQGRRRGEERSHTPTKRSTHQHERIAIDITTITPSKHSNARAHHAQRRELLPLALSLSL